MSVIAALLAVPVACVVLPAVAIAVLSRLSARPAWSAAPWPWSLGISTPVPHVRADAAGVGQVVECERCDRDLVYCPWCGHKLTVSPVVSEREHPPECRAARPEVLDLTRLTDLTYITSAGQEYPRPDRGHVGKLTGRTISSQGRNRQWPQES